MTFNVCKLLVCLQKFVKTLCKASLVNNSRKILNLLEQFGYGGVIVRAGHCIRSQT